MHYVVKVNTGASLHQLQNKLVKKLCLSIVKEKYVKKKKKKKGLRSYFGIF